MAEFTDEKDNRLTERERNPQKIQASVMKALQTKGARFIADSESVKTRHVVIGILPYVKTTKSQSRCKYGNKCYFRHVEADEKSSKKSTKGGAKDQLLY